MVVVARVVAAVAPADAPNPPQIFLGVTMGHICSQPVLYAGHHDSAHCALGQLDIPGEFVFCSEDPGSHAAAFTPGKRRPHLNRARRPLSITHGVEARRFRRRGGTREYRARTWAKACWRILRHRWGRSTPARPRAKRPGHRRVRMSVCRSCSRRALSSSSRAVSGRSARSRAATYEVPLQSGARDGGFTRATTRRASGPSSEPPEVTPATAPRTLSCSAPLPASRPRITR